MLLNKISSKSSALLVGTVVCIITAMCFESRAFVLGYSAGLVFILYHTYGDFSNWYKVKIVGVMMFLLLVLSTLFKSDSSLGRILIYKLSLQIFSEHYIDGVGIGNFAHVYGKYQRDYFANGKYTIKELLLADNTKNAFNDYLQFIIETGIPGIVTLILVFTFLYALIEKALKESKSNPFLLLFTIVQLISVLVASMFTHVLEKPLFQCIVLCGILILGYYSIILSEKKLVSATCVLLIGSLFFIHYKNQLVNYQSYKVLKKAKELAGAGYITEAVTLYKNLAPTMTDDIFFLHDYAHLLAITGDYSQAIRQYKIILRKDNSNLAFLNLADCYYRNGSFNKAEMAYRNAINMVPNRFVPRYSLFNYYMETKQLQKARHVGISILTLPVKVPSNEISLIKKSVRDKLPFNEK